MTTTPPTRSIPKRPTTSPSASEAPAAVASTIALAERPPGDRLDEAEFGLGPIGVLPWTDPELDRGGHDPRSAYVETFWLPVLGPSTTLLLRRFADEFDGAPDGFEIDCVSLSREIGLGTKMTKRAPFVRTLERCIKFNMAQLAGSVVHVRRRMPGLSARQVERLSPRLQALHRSWTIDAADDGSERRIELVRAAHLARTLLALGESAHDAERQLHRWHFHPSIAWHAVQWAQTDPAEALA